MLEGTRWEAYLSMGERTVVAREGEVLEVQGDDGAPPYLVRWSDGHEGLTYPGPDAYVVPAG